VTITATGTLPEGEVVLTVEVSTSVGYCTSTTWTAPNIWALPSIPTDLYVPRADTTLYEKLLISVDNFSEWT